MTEQPASRTVNRLGENAFNKSSATKAELLQSTAELKQILREAIAALN